MKRSAFGLVLLLCATGCIKHNDSPLAPTCAVKPSADLPSVPFGVRWDGDLRLTMTVREAGDWKLAMYAGNEGQPESVRSTDTVSQGCGDVHTLGVQDAWQSRAYRFWWFRLFFNGRVVWTSPVGDRLSQDWS